MHNNHQHHHRHNNNNNNNIAQASMMNKRANELGYPDVAFALKGVRDLDKEALAAYERLERDALAVKYPLVYMSPEKLMKSGEHTPQQQQTTIT